jgi:hypothetical protein
VKLDERDQKEISVTSLDFLGVFSRHWVVADGALSDGDVRIVPVDVGSVLGRRWMDLIEDRDV